MKIDSTLKLIKSQLFLSLKLIRFNNITGVWLLFFPALFGVLLANKTPNDANILNILGLFFIGSFVMRSAGCIINDVADRKFDKKVTRTKSRPLASEEMHLFTAFGVLALLLAIGLAILLQFNLLSIQLGIGALILAIIYPFAKRFTHYPQFFLGLAFSFGCLIANAAINNNVTQPIVLLYAACVVWSLIYDTIYAYQDVKDDLKAGIKSSAIKFGENPQKILFALTGLQIILLIGVGLLADLSLMYYFLIYIMAILSLCHIKTCDFSDAQICMNRFKSHVNVGLITAMALFIG